MGDKNKGFYLYEAILDEQFLITFNGLKTGSEEMQISSKVV